MKLKKCFALCLALCALCLTLVGCGSKEAETAFAAGTTINGMDVTGMTPAQVSDGMAARLERYSFTLMLGEKEYVFSAEELYLQCSEDLDFQTLLDRQKETGATEFTVENIYTADMSNLELALTLGLSEEEQGAKNATLTYDAAQKRFVIVPEEYGEGLDAAAVAQACLPTVLELGRTLELELSRFGAQPTVTTESPELLAALEKANQALELELTYTFTPDGKASSSFTLSRGALGELYYLDDALNVKVDEDALNAFVAELADEYSVASKSAQFRTSHGSYINIRVSQGGQSVNAAALYEDMLKCLENGTGGTRTAPYAAADDNDEGYWGGNYVEVDLTSQQLWLYKNGTCVLNCGVVSGCVYDGTTTTTGVFQIYSKQTDRYLNGYNVDGTKYHTWVNYFLPFNGGIAFHDATWRSTFGGTEYYYDGSHGCVGVSLSNAKTIYDNVSVGTHVVVYGGIAKSDLPGRSQSVTAAASLAELTVGGETNIQVSGNKTTPAFTSSDPAVVTVDGNGIVRAVGAGSATITVTCPAGSGYSAASATVTITVTASGGEQPPAEHVHEWTEIVETVAHAEEFHYEEKVVTEAYDETVTLWVCDGCQTEFATEDEAKSHAETDGVTYQAKEKTIHHDAVVEQVKVVDKEAWTETVTTVVCVSCGEEQAQ